MRVQVQRRYNDSVTITRGPLVYSLLIGEQWKKLRGNGPDSYYELYPTTPWNYGLVIDPKNPEKSLRIVSRPLGKAIFSSSDAPVQMQAKGKLIPSWALDQNAAAAPPLSPVSSTEPIQDITLVPYGCAKLRVTEFPLIDTK